MIYKFKNTMFVGDLHQQIAVEELRLYAIYVRLDDNSPELTVTLIHPSTGWQHSVTYRDSSVLDFHRANDYDSIFRAALAKMGTDGKIPEGSIKADV